MEAIQAYGYWLKEPNQPLVREDFTIDAVHDDEVVVKVAGCGLCHTDLSFYTGQVGTKQAFPLIMGHEISGKVVAAGRAVPTLLGKEIIIPAVLPCGECELCQQGRDNICQLQKMPGNDFNGGFASHVKVPARFVCELPSELGPFCVSDLSVVADAITTPYQSLKRSGLKKDDVAVVIGTGGIGIYMVQHANIEGATVIALDIDEKKLEIAKAQGAKHILCTKGMSDRDIKKAVRGLVKEHQLPQVGWKVFETSGTAAGQMAAFGLMSFAGTVGIIGFTMEKLTIRLSSIMAFDADLFGNWGCRPAYYKEVVERVLDGRIQLLDNIEKRSLDSINATIQLALAHKLEKRVIFVP